MHASYRKFGENPSYALEQEISTSDLISAVQFYTMCYPECQPEYSSADLVDGIADTFHRAILQRSYRSKDRSPEAPQHHRRRGLLSDTGWQASTPPNGRQFGREARLR